MEAPEPIMFVVSWLVLLGAIVLVLATTILSLPVLILSGFLYIFLLPHFGLVVEHLYMLRLGGWGHVKLMNYGKKEFALPPTNPESPEKQPPPLHSMLTGISLTETIKVFIVPSFVDNLTYVIVNINTGVAAIVDPGDEENVVYGLHQIQASIKPNEIDVRAILLTHKHWDHVAGVPGVKKMFPGATCYCGASENSPFADSHVKNNDTITVSDLQFHVVAVPAHTRGSCIFFLRKSDKEGFSAIFTGDTLFGGGCGASFEAGLSNAYSMRRCFAEIVVQLNAHGDAENCKIFSGHDYVNTMMKRELNSATKESNGNIIDKLSLSTTVTSTKFPPAFFFKLCENFYVSERKRLLKIVNSPTYLETELAISPIFRLLRDLIGHLNLCLKEWVVCENIDGEPPVDVDVDVDVDVEKKKKAATSFSTVYTQDLEALAKGLEPNMLDMMTIEEYPPPAAEKVEAIEIKKTRVKLLTALFSVGFSPFAISNRDARKMNLPAKKSTPLLDECVDLNRIVKIAR